MYLAEQIGPDLGLRYDDGRRSQGAQDPADGPDVVHGRVEHAIRDAAEFFIGGRAAGSRGGGYEEMAIGKFGTQTAGKFQTGNYFSHRNCMQPDRAGSGLFE